MAIKSFKDRKTERLWHDENVLQFRSFAQQARQRLYRLDAAQNLGDLAAVQGYRLHRLHGDREGQYAIRINDQWRLCFRWTEGAESIEIIEYH
ncbi:MAG: hypothetical protein EXQ91_07610 [Alphaproteobacteria bacterium]|nr:hypothetical protein [Alphaproteobacteria bacterium]